MAQVYALAGYSLDMVNFSQVVALSRDAQLRQAERERIDQGFVEDVMALVQEQVEAEQGHFAAVGEWTRLSEYALQTYRVAFPEGCNIREAQLVAAGRVEPSRNVFMVGASGGNAEPRPVKDRQEAAEQVFDYLLGLVNEMQRLHQR